MRILVLGAAGMLGHKLLQRLSQHHDTWGTVRGAPDSAVEIPGFGRERLVGGVRADDLALIRRALDEVTPDAVLNCIGIVKQIDAAKDAITSITINALLPHQLAQLCGESWGAPDPLQHRLRLLRAGRALP